jgi:hypothetical protein
MKAQSKTTGKTAKAKIKPNGAVVWMSLAAIMILIYIGTMIVLFLSHLKIVFEPPLLLPIMNTIFAALIPVTVSIIAARAYLYSGFVKYPFYIPKINRQNQAF